MWFINIFCVFRRLDTVKYRLMNVRCFYKCHVSSLGYIYIETNKEFNPFPRLFKFKFLLPGQEDCVFFSGHLNLRAKPETGIPYGGKNYNN
jgi:hypothetical protein